MSIVSQQDDLRDLRTRFKGAFIIVSVVLFILLTRLWYLQVIRGGYFFEFSQSNTLKQVRFPAPRGRIFDRNGVVIADNRPSFQAKINRQYISDTKVSNMALAELLGVPIQEIQNALIKGRTEPRYRPIPIKSNLTHEQLARLEISKLFFPGLDTAAIPARHYVYPFETFHLLGHIGEIDPDEIEYFSKERPGVYNQKDIIGKSGIEKFRDLDLKGTDGGEQVAVDALGRRTDDALFIRDLQDQKAVPGNDVYLTIDIELQKTVREIFERKEYAGSAVAMNVQDGSILLMYSSPSLNPHMFVRTITQPEMAAIIENIKKPLIDKSLQGQYPPGSTYKIVTAAAGLELNVIDPKKKVFCPGYYQLGGRGRKYRCWKSEGHGYVDMHRALVESCDVYFYDLGRKIGIDRIAEYARRFGLGSATGLGFNSEKPGLTPTEEWKLKNRNEAWQPGETLSASIGQGFNLVTPIQMARMIATLVNGGKIFRPWVVQKTMTPERSLIQKYEGEVMGHLNLSDESRKIIIDGLRDVVQTPRGTAYWTRLRDVVHGGKTGTAQVIRLEQNQRRLKPHEMKYLHRDHAWFVSFAPVENPEIAVAVVIEHGGHGSTAAAPTARDIIARYFQLKDERKQMAGFVGPLLPPPAHSPPIEKSKATPLETPQLTPIPSLTPIPIESEDEFHD